MPPRKPAGDRIVIPIDTNMLNGFVEIDKIMKNPGLAPQVLANPSQIPNDISEIGYAAFFDVFLITRMDTAKRSNAAAHMMTQVRTLPRDTQAPATT